MNLANVQSLTFFPKPLFIPKLFHHSSYTIHAFEWASHAFTKCFTVNKEINSISISKNYPKFILKEKTTPGFFAK
jgi:hypothetical protein